jgi:hypothetical protein
MTRQSVNQAFAALIHPGNNMPFIRRVPEWARYLLDEVAEPTEAFRHIVIDAPPRYSQRFWSVGAVLALMIGGTEAQKHYGLEGSTKEASLNLFEIAKDQVRGLVAGEVEIRKDRRLMVYRGGKTTLRPVSAHNLQKVKWAGIVSYPMAGVEVARTLPEANRPRFVIEPRAYHITAENHEEVVRGHNRRVRIDTHDHADGQITTRRYEVFA